MTYSQTLLARRQKFAAQQQNRTSINVNERALGPISNTIIIVIMACILGLLYLTQVTKTNTLSYELNDLKQQESQLQTERNELEITVARLQSLEEARNSEVATSLPTITPSDTLR
jgi:cell division protein FtsL